MSWGPSCPGTTWSGGTTIVFTSSGRQGWLSLQAFTASHPPLAWLDGQSPRGGIRTICRGFVLFVQQAKGFLTQLKTGSAALPPAPPYGLLARWASQRGLFRRCTATCLFLEQPSADEDRPAPGGVRSARKCVSTRRNYWLSGAGVVTAIIPLAARRSGKARAGPRASERRRVCATNQGHEWAPPIPRGDIPPLALACAL